MQLILVQSDIEQALKNYVNELLTVKPGMAITVDLRATRGADGATAVIDISPEASATDTPVVTKTAAVAPAKQTKATSPQPDTEKEDKQSVTKNSTLHEDNEQFDTSGGQVQEAAAEEVQAAATESAATDKPARSLFGGLNKPKN